MKSQETVQPLASLAQKSKQTTPLIGRISPHTGRHTLLRR